MPKNIPVNIPPGDPENVRKQVTQYMNRIGEKIAASDRRTANMEMQGNRVTGVADPGAPTDAVNLRTLKKHLDDITMQHVQRRQAGSAGGSGNFRVVFAVTGTLVSGSQAPGYIFFHGATPVNVKVTALGTATATGGAKFNMARIRVTNGTATTSQNILAADLTLPVSNYGPVNVTNFSPSISFQTNDILVPVVSTAGGSSYVTLEVEVQP
jgi:hypothetical protein